MFPAREWPTNFSGSLRSVGYHYSPRLLVAVKISHFTDPTPVQGDNSSRTPATVNVPSVADPNGVRFDTFRLGSSMCLIAGSFCALAANYLFFAFSSFPRVWRFFQNAGHGEDSTCYRPKCGSVWYSFPPKSSMCLILAIIFIHMMPYSVLT